MRKEGFDLLANDIDALAEQLRDMTEQALYSLTPIAENIIKGVITSEKEIDRHLTSMLDFCYDDRVLLLYKRVLRSLHKKHPELVYDYCRFYQDMWSGDEAEQGNTNNNDGHGEKRATEYE